MLENLSERKFFFKKKFLYIKNYFLTDFLKMKLTDFEKGRLFELVKSGMSFRKVAKKFRLSHTGASKIFRTFSTEKRNVRQETRGRKRKLGGRMARIIARRAASVPHITSKILARDIESNNIPSSKGETMTVSERTVRRSLRRSGLVAYTKPKRPMLTRYNKKARYDFCCQHADWTKKDWEKVIFSDETRVNFLGSDGRKYSWRRPGTPLRDCDVRPTRLFGGGGVMIWGCFGFKGTGWSCRFEKGMDSTLYMEVIKDELLGSVEHCVADEKDWIFQQDNAAAHTALKCRDLFREKNIRLLDFPPRSPDLNPIENLWAIVKSRVNRNGPYTSSDALWNEFSKEFYAIDPALCQKLVHSMVDRVAAVKKAKGGYTKY